MKAIRRDFNTALVLLVAVAGSLLFPSCDGGTGLLTPGLPSPHRAWVAIDPIQCLGNPWERDWLATHGNNYGAYPGDLASQYRIMREYYARFRVDVGEIISIPKYWATCDACGCPRGDALYLHVRELDVPTMLRLGFRKEAPYLLPFPNDTTLLGTYRYVGYDSSGIIPLIHGTLTFVRREETFVSGVWNFAGSGGYGPQVGTGSFTGEIHGQVIGLNLNPGWVDNNVVLLGELNAGAYTGRWEVITFAGIGYTGNFVALKYPR